MQEEDTPQVGESRTGPSFVPIGHGNGVSSVQLCSQPMPRHCWSSKPTVLGRVGWLILSWFELSGGDLWDACCLQSLLCLFWHLPAHASLQFIGQNPPQIPLRWRSSVLSMGAGQAGGSPGRMTKWLPSIWSVVPMPALPCRMSVSGRNVHSCQVRTNSKRSLNFYRAEDSWFTAPSPRD